MRIGFLSEAVPYLPCREGFRIYGANLIRCLSRNHQLDLIALAGNEDRSHLDWAKSHTASLATIGVGAHRPGARIANAVSSYLLGRPRHYRATFAGLVDRARDDRRWDVLHVEGPFAGGLAGDLSLPKILSVHDSTTARWRDLARRAPSMGLRVRAVLMGLYARRYERLVYPRFDRCVVVTEKEREALMRIAPTAKIEVIGNGTDTVYFSPEPMQSAAEAALVFHGNLSYPPNVDGALEFAEHVFPHVLEQCPTATFHLVGADPAPEIRRLLSRPGIRLSANVADVRPSLAGARIYVCGIRHAGGIKNKLLEAMAMALPVVTYAGATSGIDCEDETHMLAVETREEFGRRVVELLRDPDRARVLGDNARRLMVESYSWESRAGEFERLYRDAIGGARTRANAPQVEVDLPRASGRRTR
jgi:glycosyltransferase involved in cell wall biosynthesis